jgi:predicted RNase H-like HicB family nuclease
MCRVAKRRRIKVTFVVTPDMMDGGYTIQCRETPAMISQGKNIKDAVANLLEVWIEHFEFEMEKK